MVRRLIAELVSCVINRVLLTAVNSQRFSYHRHDSIQSTDYIAYYFFLNLRVCREKLKSKMKNQWRHSANLQKICNIVGPKTCNIRDKQGMLFSIMLLFGNTWFLFLSGAAECWLVEQLCVSGRLAFWLLLLHVVLLSCILIGWVPFLSSRWQDFLLCLHSDWLSGLQWFGEEGCLHVWNGLK